MTMVKTYAAGEFKSTCLRVMEQVSATGIDVVVTKRGRPLVRVVPIRNEKPNDLEGMILHQDEDLFSTGERWNAGK